ncbi:hypothetical protein [Polyangium aurulentum]|uniref:hypothetical protein n=1 Tax=Polyangium aurulentum TaxID=2567896 RepID=UPI001F3DD16D|nr:hypothetical protein [Polyangium aurulentum]
MRRPSHLAHLLAAFGLAAGALSLTSPAAAEGTALRASLVEAKSLKLDGLIKEWPDGLVNLPHAVKGKPGKADLEARATLAYDGTSVFVAVDVTDDALRGGGDHIALVLGFPGGAVHEVLLYPGEPGKSAASAKTKEGKTLAGAKVIEAPQKGGYTLEASIPWSAFPPAATTRVGLRGAIFVRDADTGTAVDAAVGTAPSAAYEGLPPISIESEQALAEGLLKQKGVRGAPKYNLIADVAGDALKERVLVYDRYLVVLGPTFRKGSEYYWNDLGVDVASGMLPSFETRDVTGDGQAEIILRKRVGATSKNREVLQVLQFAGSDVPSVLFQHETGIVTDKGAVENEVRFDADGAKVAITILPGKAKGLNASNYSEPRETSYDPLLLPWGPIASQSYKWNGKAFVKSAEEKQAASPAVASAGGGAKAPDAGVQKAPSGPSASEVLDRVHALYKKDRNVSGKPRFDLAADVGGDGQVERVLVHERDLVVFGKGFKGGTGYSFLSLSQFAQPGDITDVTAKDVTGDGKAEIIVKGTMHANASPEAGGGTVDREVMVVYQVSGETLRRVFSAETARAIGKKRVAGNVRFVQSGKGVEIELGPGKATEWTQASYPFQQENAASGGLEPLLLPWGGMSPVRYRWTGSGFTRQ